MTSLVLDPPAPAKPLPSPGLGRSLPPRRGVVHVLPSLAQEASGPSHSVIGLCQALARTAYTPTLAAIDGGTWLPASSYLQVFARGFGPQKLGRSPALRAWLDRATTSGEAAIVHNHGFWMMPNVYTGWATERASVPLVVSPRGTLAPHAFRSGSLVKRVFWPLLQRPSIEHTACFHATSEQERRDIRAFGFRQPIAVIPNGIALPALREKGTGETRTLLYLGRLHPIKGIDRLLRAWARVAPRHPSWNLRIVGPDDGNEADLRRLASQLRLPRTTFAGAVYGEAKWDEYSAADLYVLPTHTENFGMSVAEALASRVPVIVTKGAPWQSLVEKEAGWWIDHGVDPLVEALDAALATEPQALARMGERGRRWMEQDYSWGHVAEEMARVYTWLLDGGGPPESVALT